MNDVSRRTAGLGTPESPRLRQQLTSVLRASTQFVTIDSAVEALGLDRRRAAKLLSRWAQQGWLKHVRRGLYAPVALDMTADRFVMEDPWVLAARLFEPGYVGGWTAAEHWDLTEQIFRSVCVFTTKPIRKKEQTVVGVPFALKRVAARRDLRHEVDLARPSQGGRVRPGPHHRRHARRSRRRRWHCSRQRMPDAPPGGDRHAVTGARGVRGQAGQRGGVQAPRIPGVARARLRGRSPRRARRGSQPATPSWIRRWPALGSSGSGGFGCLTAGSAEVRRD